MAARERAAGTGPAPEHIVTRRAWTLGPVAAILAAGGVLAPAAGDAPTDRLRPDARSAPHDDPGILVLAGAGADAVGRVWFGDEAAPAVVPWAGGGVTVVVPPGPPDTRVPLTVEFTDGTARRLGWFLHEGVFRGAARSARSESGVACGGSGPGARPGRASGALTRARVTRERGGTFRYEYEFRAGRAASLVLRWETLEPLGFRNGVAWRLSAGERVRMTRRSEAPPVVVRGDATADGIRDCAGHGEDPVGGAPEHRWASPAFLSDDLLPALAPAGDLRVGEVVAGRVEATWTAPAGAVPDEWEVVARSVAPGAGGGRASRVTWVGRVPGVAVSATAPCGPAGAATLSVRPLLRGVPGPVAVAVVPRR